MIRLAVTPEEGNPGRNDDLSFNLSQLSTKFTKDTKENRILHPFSGSPIGFWLLACNYLNLFVSSVNSVDELPFLGLISASLNISHIPDGFAGVFTGV